MRVYNALKFGGGNSVRTDPMNCSSYARPLFQWPPELESPTPVSGVINVIEVLFTVAVLGEILFLKLRTGMLKTFQPEAAFWPDAMDY